MSLPVHLVPTLAGIGGGAAMVVEGDEAHHAVAVRRMAVGEQLILTDGVGTGAYATVSGTGKRRLEVLVERVETAPPPQPSITVVQGLPKGDRGELAVELLTEIGVARIVPWAASRSVAVWRGERAVKSRDKWSATAREAAKQSRRWWHPEVTLLASTDHVVELVRAADVAVVLHEEATEALPIIDTAASVVIVVGPEGGLSADEVERLVAAGGRSVHLGKEVLRTSTAGLAACAALLAQTPRWH